MRRLCLWTIGLFVVFAPVGTSDAGDRPPPFKRGEVVSRTSARGVPYAVYLPKTWSRRKRLPLVVFTPTTQMTPTEALANAGIQETCNRWNPDEGGVIGCSILFQAHNRLKAQVGMTASDFEPERWEVFLDQDASTLDQVLAEVGAEIPYHSHGVGLYAVAFACDVALGVALRRPKRFAAMMLYDFTTATLQPTRGKGLHWYVLPNKEVPAAARDLPVLFLFPEWYRNDQEMEDRYAEAATYLLEQGMRKTEVLTVGPQRSKEEVAYAPAHEKFLESIKCRRERAVREEARDALLDDARKALDRNRLSSAVKAYRKARDLEATHALDTASAPLYEALVARGRELLEAARALEDRKRKPQLAKIARWFKDTPFAEEVKQAR